MQRGVFLNKVKIVSPSKKNKKIRHAFSHETETRWYSPKYSKMH